MRQTLMPWLSSMFREEVPSPLHTTRKIYARATLPMRQVPRSASHILPFLVHMEADLAPLHMYTYVPRPEPLHISHCALLSRESIPFLKVSVSDSFEVQIPILRHPCPRSPDSRFPLQRSFLFSRSWLAPREASLGLFFSPQDAYCSSRSLLPPRDARMFSELIPSSKVHMTSSLFLS